MLSVNWWIFLVATFTQQNSQSQVFMGNTELLNFNVLCFIQQTQFSIQIATHSGFLKNWPLSLRYLDADYGVNIWVEFSVPSCCNSVRGVSWQNSRGYGRGGEGLNWKQWAQLLWGRRLGPPPKNLDSRPLTSSYSQRDLGPVMSPSYTLLSWSCHGAVDVPASPNWGFGYESCCECLFLPSGHETWHSPPSLINLTWVLQYPTWGI